MIVTVRIFSKRVGSDILINYKKLYDLIAPDYSGAIFGVNYEKVYNR